MKNFAIEFKTRIRWKHHENYTNAFIHIAFMISYTTFVKKKKVYCYYFDLISLSLFFSPSCYLFFLGLLNLTKSVITPLTSFLTNNQCCKKMLLLTFFCVLTFNLFFIFVFFILFCGGIMAINNDIKKVHSY